MELNELIRTARGEHGLTQQQLADGVGVTLRTIGRWETGASVPRSSAIAKLSAALHVAPAALVDHASGPAARRDLARTYRQLLGDDPTLRELLEPSPFGPRLRHAMAWRRLRSDDVAGYLAVVPRTVRRWMRGQAPRWTQQAALAHLLDVPVWWLHTSYLDGCELLGHPAENLHTEPDEIARLRSVMERPDGWRHDETDVDEEFLAAVAGAHDLPLDDLRRVAYPWATRWRWDGRAFEPPADSASPFPGRLSAALAARVALDGRPRTIAESTVFAASLLRVAEETIMRWARGASESSADQASQLACALCIPSWQLWLDD
jgi:transcriptional regulator with XRE-family HTH domain